MKPSILEMQYKLISLHNALHAWKLIAPTEYEYDENDLIEWSMDCLGSIGAYNLYSEKIAKLNFDNHKIVMPSDFKKVLQILLKPEKGQNFKMPELIEFSTKAYGEDCKWEYKKVCKCQESCSCENVIEIPGTYYLEKLAEVNNLKFGTIEYLSNFEKTKDWIKLSPSRGVFDFTDELKKGNIYTYKVDGFNNILLDVKKGTVLLSYLGYVTDDEGIPMIPNTETVLNAIKYYIETNLAYIRYRQTRNGVDLNFYQLSEGLKNMWIERARNDLNMLSQEEQVELGKAFKNPLSYTNSLFSTNYRNSLKNKFTTF